MLSDQNFRMNSDRSELIKALIKENMGGPRMGAITYCGEPEPGCKVDQCGINCRVYDCSEYCRGVCYVCKAQCSTECKVIV